LGLEADTNPFAKRLDEYDLLHIRVSVDRCVVVDKPANHDGVSVGRITVGLSVAL